MALEPAAATLLARIEAFGFSAADDPLGFESRLADDNGWTLGHALAVAAEYRRFLVLTQVAGHPVSPSPDVDEAWHLHLTRTVDYGALCREVFGRFLHHEPSRAGGGDAATYRTMYADTLAAYLHAFDRRPPEAIWPDVDRRHAAKPVAAPWPSWTVPSNLQRGHRLGIAAIALAVVCGWLAHAAAIASVLPALPGATFAGVAVCVTPLLAWLAWQGGAPARAASDRDLLDPYEAAWLSGGARRMTSTAIATLVERGVLLTRHAGVVSTAPPIGVDMTRAAEGRHPVEQACLSAVADGGLRPGAACLAVEPLAWRCEQRLIAAGVATDESALSLPRAAALLGLTLLLAAEVERFVAALGTAHPVGLLVVLIVLGAVLMLVVAQRLRRSTERADASLKRLRLGNGAVRKGAREGAALSYAVALMGGYALTADPRFTGLGRVLDGGPVAGRRDRGALRGNGSDAGSDCSACGDLSACGSGDGGGMDGGHGGGDAGGSACSGGSSCGGGGGGD